MNYYASVWMKAGETQHESLFNQARQSVCMSYYLHAHKYIACLAWNSWELNSLAFFFSVFQTKLLTQYVLNLAKYDQNYDIRDRARFIRQLIVPTDKSGALHKYAKKLFLALKPAPILESPFKGKGFHFS